MEDQHNNELPDKVKEEIEKQGKPKGKTTEEEIAFFGVYDGHSGDECPKFLNKNLLKNILKFEPKEGPYFENDDIIKKAYMDTDTLFKTNVVDHTQDTSGSTCTSVMVKRLENKIKVICPNVGDSRTIMYDGNKTIALSKDHKPDDEVEKQRINNAGYGVTMGRVDGVLALSRAFGDFVYKKNTSKAQAEQAVSVCPDVTRTEMELATKKQGGLQFVVLACDGIWDVMTNEQVAGFVQQRVQEQLKGTYKAARMVRAKADVTQNSIIPQEEHEQFLGELKARTDKIKDNEISPAAIAEDLIDNAVIKLDSKDNVSAIVVLFHSGDLADYQEKF
eukprot:CAMPEP_0117426588 /NCGR_PEP_ID=MMETSP0758-20121206/6653_1 /TAXON_ID=63605 /ORGANISM="Percolomonas cosmopolitus, Strain AE-1 (ATCC 50343)" /LENGTH=332 /DNA_ID=CAMNT_0005211809 /DNA_START=111 /DNA_END=1109 /DNA_ORIENTATION=+